MQRIGLIAGNGRFPIIFAENAKKNDITVTAVAHIGETLPELEKLVDRIVWIKVGELGKLIKTFKADNIKDVVLAGGIKKTRLFTDVKIDFKSIMLLTRIRDKKDDAILRAVAEELEKEGIIVRESTLYLSSILAQKGNITSVKPSAKEMEDIKFGRAILKDIGRHDIGQCIIVKNRVVLAVEAVEGTDEAIKRGGLLGGPGSVIIKMTKPHQDMRFDLPAIGINTINSMVESKAKVLAIEVGKTIILDIDQTIKRGEEEKISIVGIE